MKSLESEFHWFLCHITLSGVGQRELIALYFAHKLLFVNDGIAFCTQIITLCKLLDYILHTNHYTLLTVALHFLHNDNLVLDILQMITLHFANNWLLDTKLLHCTLQTIYYLTFCIYDSLILTMCGWQDLKIQLATNILRTIAKWGYAL